MVWDLVKNRHYAPRRYYFIPSKLVRCPIKRFPQFFLLSNPFFVSLNSNQAQHECGDMERGAAQVKGTEKTRSYKMQCVCKASTRSLALRHSCSSPSPQCDSVCRKQLPHLCGDEPKKTCLTVDLTQFLVCARKGISIHVTCKRHWVIGDTMLLHGPVQDTRESG